MKKYILLVLLMVFTLFLLCGCGEKITNREEYELIKSNELPVTRVDASYVMDTNDLTEVIGYADYVFIGKVLEYKLTQNDSKSQIPKTCYRIEIIENIKGDLKREIEIDKLGGLSADRKSKIIMQNDILPLENEYYIFIASANSSHRIDVFGNNSNFKIEGVENLSSNKKYNTIKEEVEKNVSYDRPRYDSVYEKEY